MCVYIQGKHDPSSVRYVTPQLKPILDVTYGCMVYQEQVMQIVRDLAGYSMGRSDRCAAPWPRKSTT